MTAGCIIVALDMASADEAMALARQLDPSRCRVKVGKELFTAAGPALIERLAAAGFGVFLDLKFHDIPNTVAAACRSAARLGVWMLNVHAFGGRAMMEAARGAIESVSSKPLLIGVTVLTSMGQRELHEIGIDASPAQTVAKLAAMVRACGLDGVVCSAAEAGMLRGMFGADFKLVTPGIRPAGSPGDDQQRTTTPAQALALGADYLVIGRPITRAPDPLRALDAIEAEIAGVSAAAQPK